MIKNIVFLPFAVLLAGLAQSTIGNAAQPVVDTDVRGTHHE